MPTSNLQEASKALNVRLDGYREKIKELKELAAMAIADFSEQHRPIEPGSIMQVANTCNLKQFIGRQILVKEISWCNAQKSYYSNCWMVSGLLYGKDGNLGKLRISFLYYPEGNSR